MTTRCWPVAAIVAAGLWAWSAAHWIAPAPPAGWVGLDTKLGSALGRAPPACARGDRRWCARCRASRERRRALDADGEHALVGWTSRRRRHGDRGRRDRRSRRLRQCHVEIGEGQAQELYGKRIPIPVSMWQPWLAWTGRGGGAKASFFGNPVVASARRQLSPLICYEQLLVWPVLQSMIYSPAVLVAIGNDWWTAGTSILAIQRASCEPGRSCSPCRSCAFNT